jgi:diguanylate cyclase (GGDEF)-like protein
MVTIIVTSTVLALAIAAVAFGRSRVLSIWACALGVHTLAYILFSLRGQVGDIWSIVVGNTALATTFSLFAEGFFDFQRQRQPRWLTWLPVPVMAIVCIYWIDNLAARSILGGIVIAEQCLLILAALIGRRRKTTGRGQYQLMVGFFLIVVVIAFRIVETVTGSAEAVNILAASPIQTATFLATIVGLMLLAAGMPLMTQERAENELAQNRALLKQQNVALQHYSEELEAANQKLAALSITDGLTGLANRRHFDEILAAEWARARRTGKSVAILMIDVDWFKKYNDHYGHQGGDDCLSRIAGVLQAGARRTSDLAARYGGEEFAVIAPDTDLDNARALAKKLCHAVVALEMPHSQSPHGRITISVGVAAIVPEDETGAEVLLHRADASLYQAKDGGRNRVAAG